MSSLTNQRLGILFFLALLSLSCTLWSMGQERDTAITNSYYTEQIKTVSTEAENLLKHHNYNSPQHLLDLPHFSYNSDHMASAYDVCNRRHSDSGGSLVVLVVVHTAPRHHRQRNHLRQGWAQKRDDVGVVFLIGEVEDRELQLQLEQESLQYGDLLQGNFLDTYHNLSYKHAMALKFATESCSRVPYVLKCDDDVLVNMPRLLKILETRLEQKASFYQNPENEISAELILNSQKSQQTQNQKIKIKNTENTNRNSFKLENSTLSKHKSEQLRKMKKKMIENEDLKITELPTSDDTGIAENVMEIFGKNSRLEEEDDFIYCVTNVHAWVRRSYRSKWRVSPQQYPNRTYPTYCSGGFVLYPQYTVRKLYRLAQEPTAVHHLWIDDVHFTGTLAERGGTIRRNAKKRQLTRDQARRLIDRQIRIRSGGIARISGISGMRNWLLAPWETSEQDRNMLWEFVSDYTDYSK